MHPDGVLTVAIRFADEATVSARPEYLAFDIDDPFHEEARRIPSPVAPLAGQTAADFHREREELSCTPAREAFAEVGRPCLHDHGCRSRCSADPIAGATRSVHHVEVIPS